MIGAVSESVNSVNFTFDPTHWSRQILIRSSGKIKRIFFEETENYYSLKNAAGFLTALLKLVLRMIIWHPERILLLLWLLLQKSVPCSSLSDLPLLTISKACQVNPCEYDGEDLLMRFNCEKQLQINQLACVISAAALAESSAGHVLYPKYTININGQIVKLILINDPYSLMCQPLTL